MILSLVRQQPAVYHITALVALSTALWVPRFSGPLDLRYDAGVYYILGTSIAEGHGYRLLSEPGSIEAVQYPPLLPFFAAAHQKVAGSDHPAAAGHLLRLSFGLIFVAYVIAAYLLARRFLAPSLALFASLVTLFHVHTTWLSDLFFAEIPFGLATLLFFIVTGRSDGKSREWLAGILGGIAFLLRTAGAALLASWVLESLMRRHRRQALLRLSLAVIPILGWQGYIAHVKASSYDEVAYPYQRAGYQYYNVSYLENISYVDPFVPERGKVSLAGLVKRLASNLITIPPALGEAVSSRAEWGTSQLERVNREFSPVSLPLWIVPVSMSVLGLVVLVGLALLARRGEWLIPLYVLGTIGLISLTPWPGQFERYLAPLTPVLAIALFLALRYASRQSAAIRSRRLSKLARALVIAIPISVFGLEGFALYKVYTRQHREATYRDEAGGQRSYRLFFYTRAWRAHDAALDWLGRNAQRDEIVATSTPHRVYLRTGLQAVMPPYEPDVSRAQELVDAVPVDYILVDSLEFVDISRRYARPIVQTFQDRWELVYSTRDSLTAIYRRSRPETRNRGSS